MTDFSARRKRQQLRAPYEVLASQRWGRQTALQTLRLLVEYRKRLELPAAHVAEQMGIAPEIIYRLERVHLDERDVRLSTVLRYARCLGLDLELVEAEDE